MKMKFLVVLTLIFAAAYVAAGSRYPSIYASNCRQQEDTETCETGASVVDTIPKNKKVSEIDPAQDFRSITESVNSELLLELLKKEENAFVPYYGTHNVKNFYLGQNEDSKFAYFVLVRNDQVGSHIKQFSVNINKDRLKDRGGEVVKAEVYWNPQRGVMIDYFAKEGVKIADSCYLDITPLLSALEVNRRRMQDERVDIGKFGSD